MERQLLRRRRAARLGWACKEGRGQWPARAMREHRCFLRKRVSSRVWCCCSCRSRLGELEPAVDVQSCPVQSGDGKMFWGWHLHLQLWRQVSGGRRRGQSASQPASQPTNKQGRLGSAAISKPAQPDLTAGPTLHSLLSVSTQLCAQQRSCKRRSHWLLHLAVSKIYRRLAPLRSTLEPHSRGDVMMLLLTCLLVLAYDLAYPWMSQQPVRVFYLLRPFLSSLRASVLPRPFPQ